jgi:transcriptional regulator with XRE-family HTH domain
MTTETIPARLTCVNYNLLQPIASSTGGHHNRQPMASGTRPIFHRAIGESLAKLRTERGLSQMQVEIASKGRLRAGTLKSIETGRIKNPDPDHLREMSRIYGVKFDRIAEPFLVANYGRDLVRHFGDQQSDLSVTKEGAANVPAAARVFELESDNERLRDALAKVQNVASQLVQIAKVGVEGDSTATARSGRSRRDRKTG